MFSGHQEDGVRRGGVEGRRGQDKERQERQEEVRKRKPAGGVVKSTQMVLMGALGGYLHHPTSHSPKSKALPTAAVRLCVRVPECDSDTAARQLKTRCGSSACALLL